MPEVPVIQLADEARDLGSILIAKYHPHLADAKILYLFTDQKRKKCDRVKVGSAAKMNAMQRFLASSMESVESGPDFILLFDKNWWEVVEEPQQRALVDHELMHCSVSVKSGLSWIRLEDGEDKGDYSEWRWSMRGHDVEEFKAVIERHGWWKSDIREQEFAKQAKQLPLPGTTILEVSRN